MTKIIDNPHNHELLKTLIKEIKKSFYGKDDSIELLIVALLGQGHVLIEDVPGVGKTTLARALAKAINCSFKRIQFTSDLVPSDIIGISIWDKNSNAFVFREGPVFAHIVLADEINRSTPKTQSALLESMNEYQVSVDNHTYLLPKPFFIVATENPLEFYGVYPLPENELDRFMMSISIGYPEPETEAEIIAENNPSINVDKTQTLLTGNDILKMQEEAGKIFVSKELIDYTVTIVNKTRNCSELLVGASPRAGKHLISASRAFAYLQGRSFVLPDDIKKLAKPVLAHKLILNQSLNSRNRIIVENLIDAILSSTKVP